MTDKVIEYGILDPLDFITECRKSIGMDVRVALTELGESHFDIDKFEEDYIRIIECGYYIIDLTEKYPKFRRYIIEKYKEKE